MRDVLGHEQFGVQGGDFGAIVSQRLAQDHPQHVIGVHLNRYKRPAAAPGVGLVPVTADDYGPDEAGDYERNAAGVAGAASHFGVNMNDPHTLAHALEDSPVGLAAWLVERRRNWSQCGGDVERSFQPHVPARHRDALLGHSHRGLGRPSLLGNRRETPSPPRPGRVLDVPTAIGVLPADVIAMPRRHAEEDCDLRRWTRLARGGHFGPAEVPDLLVEDLRAFFARFANTDIHTIGTRRWPVTNTSSARSTSGIVVSRTASCAPPTAFRCHGAIRLLPRSRITSSTPGAASV